MRCVIVMFDSLNRHCLSAYGCSWTHTPNFARLARKVVTFETSYVCSMPCMPARRDMHTGRSEFLHRPWGPFEPFDQSVFALLRERKGVYSHLDSDHYHYWEDAGAGYNTRYDSWQFFRGQEGDTYIGQVAEPDVPEHMNGKSRRSDWVNRMHVKQEEDSSQHQTFQAGLKFIERNQSEDNWLLHIECFDPHEPFCSDRKYKDLFPNDYDGPLFDWPGYREVAETPDEIAEVRRNYAALLAQCDKSMGDVLDAFDRYDMWKDTMLIVMTDHGYLLSEHGWWAKNVPPLYEEVAHTPFFVWDPRCPEAGGQLRKSLVQPAIDLAPTLMGFFGEASTERMCGKDLAPTIADDTPVRTGAIFGYHGNRINYTDGRYVYLREPMEKGPAPIYSAHVGRRRKGLLQDAELTEPLAYAGGASILRFDGNAERATNENPQHLLFDLQSDPAQEHRLNDPTLEAQLCERIAEMMVEHDAPPELYARHGLKQPQ